MEEILKFLGAITAIIAVYKVIVDVILARSSKHREEYQFSKDYISDLDDTNVHRFVLEKGFRALTNDIYSIEEIKYLLSYLEPTKAIVLRSSGKKMIKFNAEHSLYQWIGKYQCECFRSKASFIYLSLYFIFASMFVFPLFYNKIGSLSIELPLIFTIPMGLFAITFASKHIDFNDTSEFMKLKR